MMPGVTSPGLTSKNEATVFAPINSISHSVENINTAGAIPQVNPENSVGAAQTGFDPYTKMVNENGAIAPGENPARVVDVPVSTDGADRVRHFTCTAMEAEATPESMISDFEQMVQAGQASYNPRKNKDDLKSAVSFIEQNGFDRALQAWDEKMQSGGNIETDDLIRAQLLYSAAANAGDTQTAMKLVGQIAAEYTKAGQAVQSARLLKKATPEGRLYYIRRSVDNLQKQINGKRGTKAPELQIDENLAQDVLDAQNDAELTDASDALMESVAQQMQNITEPVFNLTMMDGLQGVIKSAAYGSENAVISAFGNMVSNYAGQFVPKALSRMS